MYFQQNQCFPLKNMSYTTNIDYHWAPMLVGPPSNCPACPCVKTAPHRTIPFLSYVLVKILVYYYSFVY